MLQTMQIYHIKPFNCSWESCVKTVLSSSASSHWANWSKCWHRFAFSRVLQSTSKSSMASHWVAKNSQFSMVHWKVGIYQWGKLIHYVRVHSVDSFSTIHIKSSLCAKVPELIFPWCPEQWWPGCVLSLLEDGWFTLAFALCILR